LEGLELQRRATTCEGAEDPEWIPGTAIGFRLEDRDRIGSLGSCGKPGPS